MIIRVAPSELDLARLAFPEANIIVAAARVALKTTPALHKRDIRGKTLPENVARISDKTVWPEPPRYPVEATGYTVKASHYNQLLSRIREHCEANAIETPSEAAIEQWLCDNLSVKCVDGDGKPYPNQYLSRTNWPLVVRPMKLLLKEGDAGLGDVIHRTIGEEKSLAFQQWWKSVFGFPCGCPSRRAWLNREYPA